MISTRKLCRVRTDEGSSAADGCPRLTLPYPFSYDLDDLGQYYLAWRRLMTHWRELLGEEMLTVCYEDLVDDQEAVSRRIIDYCGLEWEDACLKFHRSKVASSTASAVQVRQPIYTSSLGMWKNYGRQLQPLVDMLTESGLKLD